MRRQRIAGRSQSLVGRIGTCLLALVLILAALPAAAQFVPNPDTAKNRQDNVFGTRPDENGSQTIIGTDPATGDQVMEAVPPPPPQNDSDPSMNLNDIEVYPIVPVPGPGPHPRPLPPRH